MKYWTFPFLPHLHLKHVMLKEIIMKCKHINIMAIKVPSKSQKKKFHLNHSKLLRLLYNPPPFLLFTWRILHITIICNIHSPHKKMLYVTWYIKNKKIKISFHKNCGPIHKSYTKAYTLVRGGRTLPKEPNNLL